jgi:hypothetical protein
MNYRGVYGGTPVGTESKCDSCIHSRVIRGYAESEHVTLCDRVWEQPIRMHFKVRECSDYSDKRLPSVEEMKKIAWMLVTKSAGKPIGFVSAEEFQKLEDKNENSS